MNNIKQVIVIRNDLGMRKGKMIAQGAHASIKFISDRLEKIQESSKSRMGNYVIGFSPIEEKWINGSFAKICVRVNSKEELLKIKDEADDAGLECHLIVDSGKTEFNGVPTETCLAIGPDYADEIDKITGHLVLL